MSTAYIVDYLRSPFTPAYRGAHAGNRPDDHVAGVACSAIARSEATRQSTVPSWIASPRSQ